MPATALRPLLLRSLSVLYGLGCVTALVLGIVCFVAMGNSFRAEVGRAPAGTAIELQPGSRPFTPGALVSVDGGTGQDCQLRGDDRSSLSGTDAATFTLDATLWHPINSFELPRQESTLLCTGSGTVSVTFDEQAGYRNLGVALLTASLLLGVWTIGTEVVFRRRDRAGTGQPQTAARAETHA